MDHVDSADIAAVVGALGFGFALVGSTRRVVFTGFALLLATEAALAWKLAGGASLAVGPGTLVAGAGAAVVVAALAYGFLRYPTVVIPVVLAAAPFRLPIDVDTRHRFLVGVASGGGLGRLLPLYVVLTAAVLAFLARLVRDRDLPGLARAVAWPVACFLGFASLSLLWSQDAEAATSRLAFFIVPFAALVAVVGRAPFAPWLPRVLAYIAIGFTLVFALVGVAQAATHRLLFFAPGVEIANSYGSIFRVTSLFRDPSLYGRHVVLGIAVVLVLAWLRLIGLAPAAALIAVLWAGLYVSYSQSSMAALFAVTLAVPVLAGSGETRRLVAITAVLVLLAGSVLVGLEARDHSVRRATSGRSRRVELALRVFADHPVAGVGLAAQQRASQAADENPGPVTNYVSHTTPLTIAAELGVIGLALYAAVLVGAIRLVDRVRRDAPALGLSLGAALLALFVHALFYSGFFEDPLTWTALAVAMSFVARHELAQADATVRGRVQPAPLRP